MLKFLKKIFHEDGKQEVVNVIQISLNELEAWIEEKSRPSMEDAKRKVDEIFMKISEEIQKTRFNLEVLENAKLQNPDIPYKAKQYMEGNRKAYIRSISIFLGRMEINNRDFSYLKNFCIEFDRLLDTVNKSTLRSYSILQEFFANEVVRIAGNLKSFDLAFKDMKNALNNEEINSMVQAEEKAKSLRLKKKQKINFDVEIKAREAELQLANEEKIRLMEEIGAFNKSGPHNEFLRLNEEKKSKSRQFYEEENKIMQSFSIMERPLRKYSHIAFEHEEITLDYINNPVEALANDKEMRILQVFENLSGMISEGALRLDDKKMEKMLNEMKRFDKNFIEEFSKKYFSFKNEIVEIEKKIDELGVAQKLRDFNKQLEDVNLRIEKTGEELEQMKSDAVKFGSSFILLSQEIEADAKKMFGENIKIAV